MTIQKSAGSAVTLPPAPVQRPPQLAGPFASAPTRALTARERAEAAFRVPAGLGSGAPAPATPPAPRTVIDRLGRGVRVEVRPARTVGQLEMPV